jgi:hypothetical protein
MLDIACLLGWTEHVPNVMISNMMNDAMHACDDACDAMRCDVTRDQHLKRMDETSVERIDFK